MIYPKVDICKNEWLELVFAKRNKEYGAYNLRKEYAHTITNVMAVTFLSVISILMIGGMVLKYNGPSEVLQATVIDLSEYKSTAIVPDGSSAGKKQSAATREVNTQLPFAPVVANNVVTTDMPATVINGPNGNEEIVAPGINIDLAASGAGSGETATNESNIIYAMNSGIEVKPQPEGGDMAWRTFMQKNLHYPPEAAAENKKGRVVLSFVVEKDGQLSNIIVEKAAGYCMDEEAYRVLKLAKAWKPGYKDGQPVRVKCPLTLSFIVGG